MGDQKTGCCRESKKKKKKKQDKKQADMSKFGVFLSIVLLCYLMSQVYARSMKLLIETADSNAPADPEGHGGSGSSGGPLNRNDPGNEPPKGPKVLSGEDYQSGDYQSGGNGTCIAGRTFCIPLTCPASQGNPRVKISGCTAMCVDTSGGCECMTPGERCVVPGGDATAGGETFFTAP